MEKSGEAIPEVFGFFWELGAVEGFLGLVDHGLGLVLNIVEEAVEAVLVGVFILVIDIDRGDAIGCISIFHREAAALGVGEDAAGHALEDGCSFGRGGSS